MTGDVPVADPAKEENVINDADEPDMQDSDPPDVQIDDGDNPMDQAAFCEDPPDEGAIVCAQITNEFCRLVFGLGCDPGAYHHTLQ